MNLFIEIKKHSVMLNNLIMNNVYEMIGGQYQNVNTGTAVKLSSFSEKESVQKKLKKDKKQMELF